MKKKEFLLVVSYIVFFSIVWVGLTYTLENHLENRILLGCEFSKLEAVGDRFRQINTYEDYLYLCSDEICKEKFETKINNSLEEINFILKIDCEEVHK